MKQTEVSKIVEKKDRRNGKGRVLALSRIVYKLSGKSTYYVESETCDNRYYFVRFEPAGFEWCSCKDFESNRTERCKHLFAIEYAIRFATVKEVDKLPEEVRGGKKSNPENNVPEESFVTLQTNVMEESSKSYLEKQSIRTLNDLEQAEIEAEEYRTQRHELSYESDQYDF